MASPACTLFVIPARDAAVAAVLRRGPGNWAQLIKWDTRRDTFDEGAWFKGRIYEERCDISPDGELFVFFCHSGNPMAGGIDVWTAVSKPPWLYALGLWPQKGTQGGGGRFLDNRQLRLHTPVPAHPSHQPIGYKVVSDDTPLELRASTNEVEGADWSGQDYHGALIFSQAGKLFRRIGTREPEDIELADFNNRKPNLQPAPAWARQPVGQ